MRAHNTTTKNRKNIHCTLVAAEHSTKQNADKTAHQIMIEAFNKHYREAESLAGWSPRMLITKAEVTRYGLVNWESSMQVWMAGYCTSRRLQACRLRTH